MSFEYIDEGSIYEDASRRRAPKIPSKAERLKAARSAQEASGTVIRIARSVLNELDFKEELRAWWRPVEEGWAERKSKGRLALTVFDTSQQPLRYCPDHSEESLTELFEARYPSLFRSTPPIEVAGTRPFGNKTTPFMGVIFAPGSPVFEERLRVRSIVAPELALDDSHQLDHVPHVSLGKIKRPGADIRELQLEITKALPKFVQLGPAEIIVASQTPPREPWA